MMPNKSTMWNLWHGCHKLSEGCRHCYVYRGNTKHDIDSAVIKKTKNFDLPVLEKWNGEYKVPAGTLVYTCFTSDSFVNYADSRRAEAWDMIRLRSDLTFLMITKRIDRLQQSIPDYWSDGYNHVTSGESGYEARPCHFDWVMEIHNVCIENDVSFWFKQTGTEFMKDGHLYIIDRKFQHSQARKAGINFKITVRGFQKIV